MKTIEINGRVYYSLVFAIALIMAIGLASGQLIGKLNNDYDIKRPCINNGTYCSASAICNISVFYPDGSLLVSNARMTNKLSYHNYTIVNTSLTKLDYYQCIMMCTDNGLSGSDSFEFLVTANGKPAPSGGVIVLFSIIFFLIIGTMVYFFFSAIGHFIKMDIDIIDVAINWGLYFMLLGAYALHNFYVANPTMESMLMMILSIGGFTNLALPALGFVLSLFIKKLKAGKNQVGARY